jgi:hypothetical protein
VNDLPFELTALQELVNPGFADPDVFGRNGDRYAEAFCERQDFLANFRTHLASTQCAVEAMRVVRLTHFICFEMF